MRGGPPVWPAGVTPSSAGMSRHARSSGREERSVDVLSIIVRRFEGQHKRQYAPGEIVDSSAWPKEAQLQRQRFIQPAPEGATVPDEDANGRLTDGVVDRVV